MKSFSFYLGAILIVLITSCGIENSAIEKRLTDLESKVDSLQLLVKNQKAELEEQEFKTRISISTINPFSTKKSVEDFLDFVDDIWDDTVDVGYDSCIKACSARYKAGKIRNLSSCFKNCVKKGTLPDNPIKTPK